MDLDKFVELNKSWLDKFEYNDYQKIGENNPAWWNGGPSYSDYTGVNILLNLERQMLWVDNDSPSESYLVYFDQEEALSCYVEQYFNDWKSPTEDELNYFSMVEGYELPWSSECAFIWED